MVAARLARCCASLLLCFIGLQWAHTTPLFKSIEIGCQKIKIFRECAIEYDNTLYYDGDEAPTIAIENIEKVNSAIGKYGWSIQGNILRKIQEEKK